MAIQQREHKIQELRNLKSVMRIDNQLKLPQVKKKIIHLRRKFENEVCFESPASFWKKKSISFNFLINKIIKEHHAKEEQSQ